MGEDDLPALAAVHDPNVGPLRRRQKGLDPGQGLLAAVAQDHGQFAFALMLGLNDHLAGVQDHPHLRHEDEERGEGHDGGHDPGDPEPPEDLPEQPQPHSGVLSR